MAAKPINRLLIHESETHWVVSPESEQVLVMTRYQTFIRQRGRLKKGAQISRITMSSPAGVLLMELTPKELKIARDVLAHAAVESANFLNGDDPLTLELVPEPRFTKTCLEFGQGDISVSVTYAAPPEDSNGESRPVIRLSNGRAWVALPHFDCLA